MNPTKPRGPRGPYKCRSETPTHIITEYWFGKITGRFI